MIKANKIYNELSIYTENRIILWGGGDYLAKDYLEKLQWFDINVIAFCDNNSAIHGTKIEGVPVISPSELQEMLKDNDDILVQIACETDEETLVKQLQDLGVVNYISQKDMEHNFSYFKKYSDINFDAKFPGNSDGNHIRLTKIDSEFTIYKENKVVLWGAGYFGKDYLEKLQWFEIDIVAFCDNNSAIHGTKIEGVPVISPSELQEMLKDNDDILVQIACETDEETLVKQLQDLGVVNYISQKDILKQLLYLKRTTNIDFDSKFKVNDNNIRISKIDSEFSIYRNNKVIILGESINNELLKIMQYNKIDIYGYCVKNSDSDKKEVNNIKVINTNELQNLLKDDDCVVIQIGDNSIEEQDLTNIGVKKYVSYNEAMEIFKYIKRCDYTLNNPELLSTFTKVDRTNDSLRVLKEHLVLNFDNEVLIICMVGKTGDVTLGKTLNTHDIKFMNTWHSIDAIDKNLINNQSHKKIKMISAVREPIVQHLSQIFEALSTIGNRGHIFRGFYNLIFPFEKSVALKDGGDIQYIFDKNIRHIETGKGKTSVENFTNEFCEKVVDIKKVPFDKEKGYTIVKEGNIEVFIYQLEKMNDIAKEVAEFVGGDFTQWEMGNVASDKWIADSYKQAQKEIRISQEYFDKCFNESYVQHFYSEADIEKFKARWRPHIRESK